MKKKQSILEFFAETLSHFPENSEKQAAMESIDKIIEYFRDLKERIRALPDSSRQMEILAAVKKLIEFTETAKQNPPLAAALGFADKKSGKSRISKSVSPGITKETLVKELSSLSTQEIQERLLDIKRTSMEQLRSLASHLKIKDQERATREELVDRIVKLGFANVRGYEMLRTEKKTEA